MSNDQNPITLRVDGTLKQLDDCPLAGWPAEVYELDGASRGESQRVVPAALPISTPSSSSSSPTAPASWSPPPTPSATWARPQGAATA
jgi:hypothetical protein